MNKKLLAFLTALLLVSLLAFGASAKDVYVKDGGEGDGTSADAPVGTFAAAVEALGGEGGQIILVGDTSISEKTTVPEQSTDLTITSENGAKLLVADRFQLANNTNNNVVTFDFPLDVTANYACFILGGYNNVVFTDNFVVTASGGGNISFFGGVHLGEVENDTDGVAEIPYSITVNGGTFERFGGGSLRNGVEQRAGAIVAPITITVNDGTFGVAGNYPTTSNNKSYNTFSISGMSILADDATLNIYGGTFNMPVCAQGRMGVFAGAASKNSAIISTSEDYYAIDGDIEINIEGGTFNGGSVVAVYTQAAYTQLMRGNFNVTVTGGTFKEGTVFDATQVKAYEGSENKATLAYSGVTIDPVRFDVVNNVEVTDNVEPLRVVFIGDSITEGYAPKAAGVDRLTESYPAKFLAYCEAAGLEVTEKEVIVGNFGVSSSGFLPSNSRYYGDLFTWDIVRNETDADVVFFAMGTNDSQGAGGTNGALLEFEKQYETFITEMGKVADKVFITNAIYRYTNNHIADHRTSAVMRPTQEKVAKKLAATDSKYVFVDLYGLTREAAISDALFQDEKGKAHEHLHPAGPGLDMMGKACFDALFNGVYAPAEDYHLTYIYVSDTGASAKFGAGTKEDPIKNIEYAFDLMKRDAEVTLHIIGTSTFVDGQGTTDGKPNAGGNAYLSMAPSKLTIVGEGEGAVLYTPDANTLKIGTDVKIDNVTLKSGSTAVSIIGCYNNVEITDTVKTNGKWNFYAGYNVFAKAEPSTTATYDSVESASTDADCTVTVNGGDYLNFVFGNGRFASDAPFGIYSGIMTATVGEGVTVGKNNASCTGINGMNYLTGTINATVNGWGTWGISEHGKCGSTEDPIVFDPAQNTGTININVADDVDSVVCRILDFDGDGDTGDFGDMVGLLKGILAGRKMGEKYYYGLESYTSILDVLHFIQKLVK